MKDETGKTALMYALEYGSKPESVYILPAAGAKTDDKDSSGKTVREYLSSNAKLFVQEIENAISVAKSMIEEQAQQDVNMETDQVNAEEARNDEISTENTDSNEGSMVNAKESSTDTDTKGNKE
jgi:hypothetical protein